ncbi:MAG: Maf family protein [Candidatus Binatia bacterium]
MRLILASTSPRRREILALLGAPFEVIAPQFYERVSAHVSIEDEVLQFAVGKAQSVANMNPGSVVIGSDTMILLNGDKIGKPDDENDARRTLGLLSGKTHTIHTSVAIIDGTGGAGVRTVETVLVTMRDFTPQEIERYLAAAEWPDKAGAYSIQGQGRNLIAAMEGDYLAAVGMPLKPIAGYLEDRGVEFGGDVAKLYASKAFLNWRTFA